jgi:pimeloyl-ACP methyl ester carboxylesterase
MSTSTITVHAKERDWTIEYAWAGDANATRTVVLLHEGLGSVAMWKGFETALAQATRARVLVYSRPGYGQSTPRAPDEAWGPDFMHRQALDVLPALLERLEITQPVTLVGHSDGGSIALIAAAAFPQRVSSVVTLAPHTHVEAICISAIEDLDRAYAQGGLRASLARYHADPDSAYHGWRNAWLNPAFRDWNLYDEVARIGCPMLAMQGLSDTYGSMEQIHGIQRRAPQTQLLEIPDCAHSPHRDQPHVVLSAIAAFMDRSIRL